ncbi:hypothetical protein MKW92_011954 [Papaver armeniacum]|nr:hypothetical protein MKW92_011954 [Papaver armeniacum]
MLLISGLILSKKKKIVFDNLLFGMCGIGNLSLKGILHRTVISNRVFKNHIFCPKIELDCIEWVMSMRSKSSILTHREPQGRQREIQSFHSG